MAEGRISPLAPERFGPLPTLGGVRLASAAAGIARRGRSDVMLALLNPGTLVSAVFTRSLCPAAPVDWCRQALAATAGRVRAVICNSGNANAFTGSSGAAAVRRTAEAVGAALGVDPLEVMVASTGVIGESLPVERIEAAVPEMAAALASPDTVAWEAAAAAICTTDTFTKGAWAPVEGTGTRVVGIAKGSGMISPDMATMLAFVFTDLAIDPATAADCLAASAEASFNRITVDSDTSTSDTVLLAATGVSGTDAAEHADAFQTALNAVTLDLAHQIVRDGEGATKFVAVTVTGAADSGAAEAIARAVADSPLFKTALAASDPNWGRIVAAVGKAGQKAYRDRLAIWIGDEQCASAGAVHPGYSEERAQAHLSGDEIELRVDVGAGTGEATIWTCDLTHGYIEINAGYRT